MTDLNISVIEGRLTSDVGEKDFGYISPGTAKLTIHVACNKSTKKGEEWVDETSFFDVTVLGKPAENLKSKIVKGSPVRVSGRLQQDRWQDQNGNNKSKIFIVADSVKVYPKEQKQNNSGNTSDFPEDFPWN
jgi:single-strand DNA-binding protein